MLLTIRMNALFILLMAAVFAGGCTNRFHKAEEKAAPSAAGLTINYESYGSLLRALDVRGRQEGWTAEDLLLKRQDLPLGGAITLLLNKTSQNEANTGFYRISVKKDGQQVYVQDGPFQEGVFRDGLWHNEYVFEVSPSVEPPLEIQVEDMLQSLSVFFVVGQGS